VKFVNETVRKSEFRTLKDKETFKAVKALVDKAAESDAVHQWHLHENDVTQIRYG
jgi:hypothetical protein